jgi:hypothetical protein
MGGSKSDSKAFSKQIAKIYPDLKLVSLLITKQTNVFCKPAVKLAYLPH